MFPLIIIAGGALGGLLYVRHRKKLYSFTTGVGYVTTNRTTGTDTLTTKAGQTVQVTQGNVAEVNSSGQVTYNGPVPGAPKPATGGVAAAPVPGVAAGLSVVVNSTQGQVTISDGGKVVWSGPLASVPATVDGKPVVLPKTPLPPPSGVAQPATTATLSPTQVRPTVSAAAPVSPAPVSVTTPTAQRTLSSAKESAL